MEYYKKYNKYGAYTYLYKRLKKGFLILTFFYNKLESFEIDKEQENCNNAWVIDRLEFNKALKTKTIY